MKHFSTSDDQLASDLAEITRIQTEMDASMRKQDRNLKRALALFETFVDEFRELVDNDRFLLAQAMSLHRKNIKELRPLTETEREVQDAIQRMSAPPSELRNVPEWLSKARDDEVAR